ERYDFMDAWGTVDDHGVSELEEMRRNRAPGRAVLLRPRIGALLPVFVLDEYEGFEVKRFVDLTDQELGSYLGANVAALAKAFQWHRSEAVIAGHAVPGPVIARRACGDGRYVAKIHGSDLEYAVRPQDRYRVLATEGLVGARTVVGASADVLARTVELVPEAAGRAHVVYPGVDVARFRPQDRTEALAWAADLVAHDPAAAAGRPPSLQQAVREGLRSRD